MLFYKTNPIIIYCFEPSRSADHLFNFYGKRDTPLYLTCDAYGAYQTLEIHFPDYVIVCGCMDHTRRRFVSAFQISGKDLKEEELRELPEAIVLELMGELYASDGALNDMTADERYIKRQDRPKEALTKVFDYIETLDENDPLFNDKMKDAIKYAKNQKIRLSRFLEDGNIPLTNAATERNVKIISTHRKNSLFSYSVDGAIAVGAITSLIETAQANGASSYYYLKYLLEQMPKYVIYGHDCNLDDMLPWSEKYRAYEMDQRMNIFNAGAPPGNKKPDTPCVKSSGASGVA